jgi:hypothetical protein
MTKKNILIIIASVAGVLLLIAGGWLIYFFSQFASYSDPALGFTIKYPAAWQVVKAPRQEVAVVFVSAKENALDLFQENINVSIQAVPGERASLKTFSDIIISQMNTVFRSSIKIVENKPIEFGAQRGQYLMFEAPKPDALSIIVAWTIKSDRAYIVTFMGKTKNFNASRQLFVESIKSFRLK